MSRHLQSDSIGDDLPFIDEHSIDVVASAEETWEAVLATTRGAFEAGPREAFARLLGCAETETRGEPGVAGSTIVGFRVASSRAPEQLRLEGEHRFSRYRLGFGIEQVGTGSRVTATTHAEFPGIRGGAYRLLVIGSRVHVLATTRMLRAVRRRAEQAHA